MMRTWRLRRAARAEDRSLAVDGGGRELRRCRVGGTGPPDDHDLGEAHRRR